MRSVRGWARALSAALREPPVFPSKTFVKRKPREDPFPPSKQVSSEGRRQRRWRAAGGRAGRGAAGSSAAVCLPVFAPTGPVAASLRVWAGDTLAVGDGVSMSPGIIYERKSGAVSVAGSKGVGSSLRCVSSAWPRRAPWAAAGSQVHTVGGGSRRAQQHAGRFPREAAAAAGSELSASGSVF